MVPSFWTVEMAPDTPSSPELNYRLATFVALESFITITYTKVVSGLAVTAESNKRERTASQGGALQPTEARIGSSQAPAEHVEEHAEGHDDEDDAIFAGGKLEALKHRVSYFHIRILTTSLERRRRLGLR